MASGLNAETTVQGNSQRSARLGLRPGGWYGLVSCLFAREAFSETVATLARFDAGPERLWDWIMFYEEVPGRPPYLLRILLPHPLRTEGDKRTVGATVQCHYSGGRLVKRIIAVQPPNLVRFRIVEQRLGIESCVALLDGSYEVRQRGDGADLVLTTTYLARLHPRRLWRPLEKFLASRLHRHILNGIRTALRHGTARAPGGCKVPGLEANPAGVRRA